MTDGKNGGPGLAALTKEHAVDVQRFALEPGFKARGGQQIVQAHSQLKPLFGRIKRIQVHDADALKRRRLNGTDQPGKIKGTAGRPGGFKNVGNQNVFAAGNRIGFQAEQRQQAGGRGLDALAQQIQILSDMRRRRCKAAQDADRQAGTAARRVHGKIGRRLQTGNALSILSPAAQSLAPKIRLFGGKLIRRQAGVKRILFVYPRAQVLGTQLREGQQQVC